MEVTEDLCVRCVLDSITDRELQQLIEETVDKIPADSRCTNDEYFNRISICKICEAYQNSVCRECGAFIQVRAAQKKGSLPFPGRK